MVNNNVDDTYVYKLEVWTGEITWTVKGGHGLIVLKHLYHQFLLGYIWGGN